MRKPKYIAVKNKSRLIVEIQDAVLRNTTAGLISTALHWRTRGFIDSLDDIPLSDELQLRPSAKRKKR